MILIVRVLLFGVLAAAPAAVVAQDMAGMPGMVQSPPVTGSLPSSQDSGGGNLGDMPPPAAPTDLYAERVYGAQEMMAARMRLQDEHGGMPASGVAFDVLEYQFRHGRNGYRWEGSGWIGSDTDRFLVKTEGDGDEGQSLESAEVQALYWHALDPYWNLEAGARFDPAPGHNRGYGVLGIEGLAPYNVDLGAALYLSSRGDLLGRLEARLEQRITPRLTLEPRVEMNFAAQDVRATRTGSGLSSAEVGARLRYRVTGSFQPYVGYNWEHRLGDTARFYELAGDEPTERSIVLGVSVMF